MVFLNDTFLFFFFRVFRVFRGYLTHYAQEVYHTEKGKKFMFRLSNWSENLLKFCLTSYKKEEILNGFNSYLKNFPIIVSK
jgi:hypothetical protein